MRLRSYFFFPFALIIISGLYAIHSIVGFSFLYNRVFEIKFDQQDTRCDIGALRQNIAQRLKLIKVQLDQAQAQGTPPQKNTLEAIESTIWQLDPTYSTLGHQKPDVCPEIYANNSIGYPLYDTGWIRPCGDVSLSKLLTVLLLPSPLPYGSCSSYTSMVLSGLTQYYASVRVIIANRYADCRIENSDTTRITQIDFSASTSEGRILNSLIGRVNTPYVFIGRNMDHLNKFARFERQISAFSIDPRVKVVGGAVRNISGHWKAGCFQTEMKNYVLEYVEGYHSSKNECMFCDFLSGPFITRTDLLKQVSFDQNMPNQVLFEDFFIRVRNTGALILNCPDAMYFSSRSQSRERRNWLPVAIKWQLNRVILPSPDPYVQTKLQFSCKDIQISCVSSDKATKSYLMPRCCIDDYAKGFGFIQSLAELHGFRIELDSGSVLGAVKMRGVLPWDVDGDLVYLSSQHEAITKLKKLFVNEGFALTIRQEPQFSLNAVAMVGGEMKFWTPEQSIELNGLQYLTNDMLPEELRNVSTKVEMNGVWIYGPANPGHYVRNRYGVECLQHARHWRHAGEISSFNQYKAGEFQRCSKQGHHACMDRFHADGNLQFYFP